MTTDPATPPGVEPAAPWYWTETATDGISIWRGTGSADDVLIAADVYDLDTAKRIISAHEADRPAARGCEGHACCTAKTHEHGCFADHGNCTDSAGHQPAEPFEDPGPWRARFTNARAASQPLGMDGAGWEYKPRTRDEWEKDQEQTR